MRFATGWNEWQGGTYLRQEAWDEFVDALAARDDVVAGTDASAAARELKRRAAATGYRIEREAHGAAPPRRTRAPTGADERPIAWAISSPTSRRVVAAHASSPGVSRWRARRWRGIATLCTGVARYPASAILTARLLLVGLAPAAHGGNRTGRVFTGDNPGGSGELLFEALCTAPATRRDLARWARPTASRLEGAYIAAVNRCAPPGNRPRRRSATPACPTWPVSCACSPGSASSWRSEATPGTPSSACSSGYGHRPLAEAAVRPRRGGLGRSLRAPGLLPPEPAEHLHGTAHRRPCSTPCWRVPATSRSRPVGPERPHQMRENGRVGQRTGGHVALSGRGRHRGGIHGAQARVGRRGSRDDGGGAGRSCRGAGTHTWKCWPKG